MGITRNSSNILAYAAANGVSFSETLMLGRQVLYVKSAEAESQLANFKLLHEPLPKDLEGQFAEPLFRALGATLVDSMDYSSFENATILHDLNEPVPAALRERYSAVFDGGTLEHVFNFPAAIKNCMDMLRIGGHYISISPANNQCGHGFYQFSPELFFSIFNPAHSFKIKLVAIGVDIPGTAIIDWYAVEDPHKVKKRVTLSNENPTHILVIAEKLSTTEGMQLRPMQSDYEMVWEAHDAIREDASGGGTLIHYYRRYTPVFLKRLIWAILGRQKNVDKRMPGLGIVNPSFYKKIDL